MKTKKVVTTETVEKKSSKKRGMTIKSQVKAGDFWSDMKTVYAPNKGTQLPH